MAIDQRAACPENEALVEYMRNWWLEMAEKKPKGYSENTERNIQRAFSNVCHCKTPIRTLKDFINIKSVGKWFVKHMQGFFSSDSGASEGDDLPKEGKKGKGTRPYLPQKNSVAYALLITLCRAHEKGVEFMRKQELIDAAEASGLARVPIAPEKGRGKQGKPGSSKNEWYSGWSVMGKLVDKCLVAKISCPAKYKLTLEGRQAAYECLLRSNMLDSTSNTVSSEKRSDSGKQDRDNLEIFSPEVVKKVAPTAVVLNTKKGMRDGIPLECLERENLSSDSAGASTSYTFVEGQRHLNGGVHLTSLRSCASFETRAFSLTSCSSSDNHVEKTGQSGSQASQKVLRMPPLELLEKFEDIYKVVLILDDREHFIRSKSRNLIENICSQYKIEIQVRRLPVGDAIWIARHKHHHTEYVLDFIVERKNVDDLRCSIRDNRYRDQKLRLLRTGLQKIIYVVEGDPNVCEAAESIKTACFTTEILEGFDVQRTMGLADTLKRYGYLTLAITDYYKLSSCEDDCKNTTVCLTYNEFIRKCEDLDKMTVSDVFATQLMQVPQVTEEIAVAVLDCYPTLYSLACAYSLLDGDGDTRAQEELLMKRSNQVISAAASRNIFRFVWLS